MYPKALKEMRKPTVGNTLQGCVSVWFPAQTESSSQCPTLTQGVCANEMNKRARCLSGCGLQLPQTGHKFKC